MSLSKNLPESMQELLRNGDKYVDAEEVERVTKSLHDGKDSETNKQKSHDNQHEREDKEKQKVGPLDQPQSNKWPTRPQYENTKGFRGATVTPKGTIELPVTLGTYPTNITILTNLVVNTPMAYNAIYGRPLLNAARAVVSTHPQSMKFPTSRGVECVRGDQYVSIKCHVDSIQVRKVEPVMMLNIELLNGRIESLNTTKKIKVANWEGPYEVIKSVKKVAYSLKDQKGKPLGRPWNVEHLKQYYE
ncbi:Reverse transcriptase domain-containing protein [Abeliophyllum distichum]|uniref:Reverse transcriptase domain-containing protein n=1 Tax=Abeliophyllum distichum TaxID=126358 RepID=A0ABD1RS15_9LAMI